MTGTRAGGQKSEMLQGLSRLDEQVSLARTSSFTPFILSEP